MSEAPSPPPERPDRRLVMLGGLLALPAWLAACGGTDDAGAAASGGPGEATSSAAAPRHQRLLRPGVALLGRVPLQLPGPDAAAAQAVWIVVNAGSDLRALAALAGDTSVADRVSLDTASSLGTVIRLQADRPVLSLHVACADRAPYTLTGAAQLGGAGVCRWDFAELDAVQALELAWTPGVDTGAAGLVEAVGAPSVPAPGAPVT